MVPNTLGRFTAWASQGPDSSGKNSLSMSAWAGPGRAIRAETTSRELTRGQGRLGLHGLGRSLWGPPGSAGEGEPASWGERARRSSQDRARPPQVASGHSLASLSSGQALDACLGPHTWGRGVGGLLQGCLRKKHRTVRDQAPGLGGPWSRLERLRCFTSLTPGVLTSRRTPTSQGLHGLLSQRVGFFSGPHRAPRGPEGPRPPHPDTQAKGSRGQEEGWKLSPRAPPGITRQPPRLVGALLTQ